MRVVLDGRVVTDHFPGIGRYVYRLAEALAELAPADTIGLLYTPGQTDQRFDLRALAERTGVELVALPTGDRPTERAIPPLLASQWSAPRILRRRSVDLFHATYWWGPYRPGTPGTVLSLYDLIALRLPAALPASRRISLAVMVRLALRSANHVLTLSAWSKADLMAHHGLSPDAVTVTPLAPDPALAPATEAEVTALRSRLALPGSYVLYLGINKPHKNLPTLLAAWPSVTERVASAGLAPPTLVVAGPWDPRYDALRSGLSAGGPSRAVRFLGPVHEADLRALYSAAAVFAFPSRYEGFGLPPLEAMACGTPVVASDATSLPEVVGDAAILVGPDDIAGWAEAISAVLSDSSLAERLRERGLARSASFTWRRTAGATLAAYHGVVGSGGRA